MASKNEPYEFRTISPQNPLALALHLALGFKIHEKCRGGLQVEVRHGPEIFSITSQSDKMIREFCSKLDGKTIYTEIELPEDKAQINLKKISTFMPDTGSVQILHRLEISWLRGKEAEPEIERHRIVSFEIAKLMREYRYEFQGSPNMEPETQVRRPKEDQGTQAQFFQSLRLIK